MATKKNTAVLRGDKEYNYFQMCIRDSPSGAPAKYDRRLPIAHEPPALLPAGMVSFP